MSTKLIAYNFRKTGVLRFFYHSLKGPTGCVNKVHRGLMCYIKKSFSDTTTSLLQPFLTVTRAVVTELMLKVTRADTMAPARIQAHHMYHLKKNRILFKIREILCILLCCRFVQSIYYLTECLFFGNFCILAFFIKRNVT